ncbi:hypothetical protein EDB19DRAFT_1831723 [Suillus lakei]|nr:hypothetical protein EDB19DRAFT_1831723 [Suillus lakei]
MVSYWILRHQVSASLSCRAAAAFDTWDEDAMDDGVEQLDIPNDEVNEEGLCAAWPPGEANTLQLCTIAKGGRERAIVVGIRVIKITIWIIDWAAPTAGEMRSVMWAQGRELRVCMTSPSTYRNVLSTSIMWTQRKELRVQGRELRVCVISLSTYRNALSASVIWAQRREPRVWGRELRVQLRELRARVSRGAGPPTWMNECIEIHSMVDSWLGGGIFHTTHWVEEEDRVELLIPGEFK